MKAEIHPDYHEVSVICSCGVAYKSGSTKKGDQYKIETCNSCHPFYTGKQKQAEAGGRIDRFNKRFSKSK